MNEMIGQRHGGDALGRKTPVNADHLGDAWIKMTADDASLSQDCDSGRQIILLINVIIRSPRLPRIPTRSKV
jgi:hypothetical protein